MTPRQIAELIYAEFTPLSKMTIEESIDHVEQLIDKCAKDYHTERLEIIIKHRIQVVAHTPVVVEVKDIFGQTQL